MRQIMIIFVLLLIPFWSCKSTGKTKANKETASKNMLVEINDYPIDYIGKEIVLTGEFHYYDASGCTIESNFCTRSPETRSDWIFSHSNSCIYVTGGMPSELKQSYTLEIVPVIKLTATVAENTEKKIYLKYISAQIMSEPEHKNQ